MLYETKYKCKVKFVSALSNKVILHIKYRQNGKLLWKRISKELCAFAKQKWWRSYYNHRIEADTLTTYEELIFFQRVIDERYEGSLEKYVEDIVRYDVLNRRAEQEDDDTISAILSRFETRGWRTCTIEIEDKS